MTNFEYHLFNLHDKHSIEVLKDNRQINPVAINHNHFIKVIESE